eukprot:Partr_v1_DN25798_c1_g1_i1_m74901 putative Solute carrier family 25
MDDEWKSTLRSNRTLFAASAASFCAVVMGAPFDSVKVRMQTGRADRSMFGWVGKVWAEEGIRGFFRGILPPMVSVNVVKTVSFGVYESVRSRLLLSSSGGESSGVRLGSCYFAAGCVAGASTSLISAPLEMVRNQRILWDHIVLNPHIETPKHAPKSATSIAYMRELIKSGGVSGGLYRGFWLHLGRDSLGTGVYWLTYECAHWLPFVSPTGTRGDAHPVAHFMAGGITGIVSWLCIFPLDLVKNIYQRQAFSSSSSSSSSSTLSVRDCFVRTWRSGGFLAFYKGVQPTLLRAFPIHGMNLLVYEYFLRVLGDL